MGKSPSFMFYPGDWLRNDISGCSLEAQGLWLRMMMIMHDAQIYGQLVLNNEEMPAEFVAKKIGISPKKYLNLLKELEFAGVINRKENGVIYSGRMERDEAIRQQNRARQEKHRAESNVDNNANVTHDVTRNVTPLSRSSHAALHSSSSSSIVSSNEETISDDNLLPQIHAGKILAGIAGELGLKKLPGSREWLKHAELAFENGFTAEHFLETFILLRKQEWRTSAVQPKTVTDHLSNLDKLRKEVGGASANGNGKPDWQVARENCDLCDERGYVERDGEHFVCKHV
jgi:DNA-binding Lrp family transcriptional regulator